MSLKKNVIANYIGQFYSIFIGIVMLPFYLHYLGVEAYGLVGFFTMMQAWFMLLDMGLTPTLSRETARLKDMPDGRLEIKKILRSLEGIFLLLGLFIAIIVWWKSSWISYSWLDIETLSLDSVEKSISIMGFLLGSRWIIGLYGSSLIGFEQQVWLNYFKIIMMTLKYVGVFFVIKYVTNDIVVFFLFQFFIGVLEYIFIQKKVYSLLPKTQFLLPSTTILKNIMPFAMGIAYTSIIWILYTQADKFLLSHFLSLKDYAYFSMLIVVSGAVMQVSAPLSQALLPRMVSLLSHNKKMEMINLYQSGMKFVAIIIFSITVIIISYPYQLLYIWTNDATGSAWAAPVMVWYIMGNAVLALTTFQYYLQYAYGDFKYHIRFNTIFPLIALPFIYFAVSYYGALGAGKVWFAMQLAVFLFWVPFIHGKFAQGIHLNLMIKDIIPPLLLSIAYYFILQKVDINFDNYTRLEGFILLLCLGFILLFLNLLLHSGFRNIVSNISKKIGK